MQRRVTAGTIHWWIPAGASSEILNSVFLELVSGGRPLGVVSPLRGFRSERHYRAATIGSGSSEHLTLELSC